MHSENKKHLGNPKAAQGQSSLTSLLVSKTDDDVKEGELQFATFITEHDLPLSLIDHLPKLIQAAYKDLKIADKIKCGRTKTTGLINNMTGQEYHEQLTKLLQDKIFLLIVAESTDKGCVKHLCMVDKSTDKGCVKHLCMVDKSTDKGCVKHLCMVDKSTDKGCVKHLCMVDESTDKGCVKHLCMVDKSTDKGCVKHLCMVDKSTDKGCVKHLCMVDESTDKGFVKHLCMVARANDNDSY
ncbi:uncharacterized protein LOC121868994 [Homarus americanus]|uniref:uncharacterized protein LOC121868994 n=1 Tax=Homarus americanus TaxID=6706 RepID=UPI001C43EC12|nr:uncharacterized protein LOC121868994 [Homarus americanus]